MGIENNSSAVEMICEGTSGHGSLMHDDTAGEKIYYMIDKLMQFRKQEKQKLEDKSILESGEVTSVNLTVLKGGSQTNTVPAEMSATFDIRLAIDVNHDEFDKQVSFRQSPMSNQTDGNDTIETPFL